MLRYALILCIAFPLTLQSQIVDSVSASGRDTIINKWWVTVGFGAGYVTNYDDHFVTFQASFSRKLSHHLITGRFASGIGDNMVRFPRPAFIDIGAMYGFTIDNNLWFLNLSVGLSYIRIKKRILRGQQDYGSYMVDVYGSETSGTIGMPWQWQIFSWFTETSRIGLGFAVGGNVNSIQSDLFLHLCMTFGNPKIPIK